MLFIILPLVIITAFSGASSAANAMGPKKFIDYNQEFIGKSDKEQCHVLSIPWYANNDYDLYVSDFSYYQTIETRGIRACISVVLFNANHQFGAVTHFTILSNLEKFIVWLSDSVLNSDETVAFIAGGIDQNLFEDAVDSVAFLASLREVLATTRINVIGEDVLGAPKFRRVALSKDGKLLVHTECENCFQALKILSYDLGNRQLLLSDEACLIDTGCYQCHQRRNNILMAKAMEELSTLDGGAREFFARHFRVNDLFGLGNQEAVRQILASLSDGEQAAVLEQRWLHLIESHVGNDRVHEGVLFLAQVLRSAVGDSLPNHVAICEDIRGISERLSDLFIVGHIYRTKIVQRDYWRHYQNVLILEDFPTQAIVVGEEGEILSHLPGERVASGLVVVKKILKKITVRSINEQSTSYLARIAKERSEKQLEEYRRESEIKMKQLLEEEAIKCGTATLENKPSAEIHSTDENGHNFFHRFVVTRKNNWATGRVLNNRLHELDEDVRVMLLNQADNDGNTPLHLAIMHDAHFLAKQLLGFVRVFAPNHQGLSPYQLAKNSENEKFGEIEQMLFEH